VTALCIRANDIVADFIGAAKSGEDLPPDYGAEEKAQFDALTSGENPDDDGEPLEEFDIDFTPVRVQIGEEDPVSADDAFADAPRAGAADGRWEIRFAPHTELYARANDPLLLFRELAS